MRTTCPPAPNSSPTTFRPWRNYRHCPRRSATTPGWSGSPATASTGSAPPDAKPAPFLIRLADGIEVTARAVIDASGTWPTPNVLGASGLPAHGETDAAAHIDGAMPDVLGADRDRYAGKHTLVVGAGYSAANTLLSLAQLADEEPGTTISWAIRTGSPDRTYGGQDADALAARGALGSRVHTPRRQRADRPAHRILRAAGSRPTATPSR